LAPPIELASCEVSKAFSCRNLPYPTISNRAALHPRMVRHKPDSIATMRSRLIAALVPLLPNCPTCARKPRKAFSCLAVYDTVVLSDGGDSKYRIIYDVLPEDGKRRQKCETLEAVTKKQAEATLAQREAEVLAQRKALESGNQPKDEIILSSRGIPEGF